MCCQEDLQLTRHGQISVERHVPPDKHSALLSQVQTQPKQTLPTVSAAQQLRLCLCKDELWQKKLPVGTGLEKWAQKSLQKCFGFRMNDMTYQFS